MVPSLADAVKKSNGKLFSLGGIEFSELKR